MNKRMTVAIALAAGALCCALAPIEPARACGGAMMEADYVQLNIAKRLKLRDAQRAVERGELEVAAIIMRSSGPFPVETTDRARRLLAKLIVRSDGAYDVLLNERGRRDDNLQKAVALLSSLSSNDPRAMTDLGEALSKRTETLNTAREVLSDLAKRDLITSAEGWAALARLSSPEGAITAMERCRRMALDAERSCGGPVGSS